MSAMSGMRRSSSKGGIDDADVDAETETRKIVNK